MSISFLAPRLKSLVIEIAGTGLSGLGVITANQEKFDYYFRQCGTLVAILSGLGVLYRVFRPRKAAS